MPSVRLISSEGKQIGVIPLQEAQTAASEVGLDLVEIEPTSNPPVCRLMDYGKFLFNQSKKKQAAKKKQKQIHIKELKFRPGTGEGDYQVKMRCLSRFLEKGDKVKVTIRFRGRELAHPEIGNEVLSRISTDVAGRAVVEQEAKLEGRQMVMVLAPQ